MKKKVFNPELKGIKKSFGVFNSFDENSESVHVYICDTSVSPAISKEAVVSKSDFEGFVFALECVGYRNVTNIPRIVSVEV